MNLIEGIGYVLCMGGLIAGIVGMIYQIKPLALWALPPMLIGAGCLIYTLQ